MLTFAYKVGGWVIANAYVSKIKQKTFKLSKFLVISYQFSGVIISGVIKKILFKNLKKICIYIYKQVMMLLFRWVGLKKSYVIYRVGQQKSYVCL